MSGGGTQAAKKPPQAETQSEIGNSEIRQLLADMNTPPSDGFTPNAPRQLLSLLDFDETEDVRILAYLWSKTVHGGLKGKRRTRTAKAEDERGDIRIKHIAADLDMRHSNVSAAMKRIVEKGRVRVDDEDAFWLRGDVPDPRLKRPKKPSDPKGEEKEKDIDSYICTDIRNQALRLYFQKLNISDRTQRVSDLIKIREYREKLKSEAMNAARDAGQEIEDFYLEHIGFEQPKKRRGRKKKARGKPGVELSLLRPPSISVQISFPNFVQKPNPTSVQNENHSAQNAYPYAESLQSCSEEELSPPTPSLAHAKEGKRESPPSSNLQAAPDPEQHWKGFCLLAKAVGMQNTEGEHESNKKLYLKLSIEEQYEAAKGIETRNLPGMQFARGFTPTMRNYLLKKLWTAPLRGTPPPASEVQKAAALQKFERLKMQRRQVIEE